MAKTQDAAGLPEKKADGTPYLSGTEWEFENALDELKVHQRGPRVVLRFNSSEKELLISGMLGGASELAGKPAVGLLDLVGLGVPGDAEDLVGVLGHWFPSSRIRET